MENSQNTQEHALPSYGTDGSPVPAYEHAPLYEATSNSSNATEPSRSTSAVGITLTIDPTGLFIKDLHAAGDAPPIYTLSKTLNHVSSTTSIHVLRAGPKGTDTQPLRVYAIGEHFISPLHTRNKIFQNVTAARSHGFLVTANIREIVWDFSIHVPAKPGDFKAGVNPASFPVDPVYMIGNAPGPGTVQKHLLQFYHGKWINEDDEVVALEREGGEECAGMPVLNVTKELNPEWMDFLISAWCVTLWGEVGKRWRRLNGRKFSLGKFHFGK